jgi:hypothetical protein
MDWKNREIYQLLRRTLGEFSVSISENYLMQKEPESNGLNWVMRTQSFFILWPLKIVEGI